MDAVIYGFGPIGRLIAECCLKKGINVVGAVDVNPEIVGKRLSDFGIDSGASVKETLEFKGDIAFLSTGSFLDRIYPQIVECLEKGFNVISTCETLSYPEFRYPELAKKLDTLAKEKGKTVLGTGINPGFLLDSLPVVLSASSVEVNAIKAVRCVDTLKRRKSFQKKVGIGMEVSEVEKMLKEGKISGHVGYAESVALICEALNFKPDEIAEGQEIVSENGKVSGMKGWGIATKGGVEKVRIEFHSIAGADEYEEIDILGDNEVKWRSTGTKGDLGTAAVVVNLAETVLEAQAGLIKMTDLIPFRMILR
ncbi:MAG: dihydrodipicolinate reductase [Archaeoglobus sp.]|nr:dihydrodipicolinate reductase [Archaeoglobus sp.]